MALGTKKACVFYGIWYIVAIGFLLLQLHGAAFVWISVVMVGIGIGGIAGWNKKGGVIAVDGHGTAGDEVVAVGSHVSVTGFKKAGGIVGIHEGILKADDGTYLTCRAALVRTREGYTGGIAG